MNVAEFVLLLSSVRGIGPRAMAEILRRNAVARRTPDEFGRLGADALAQEYGLQPAVSAAVARAMRERVTWAAGAARDLERSGIKTLTTSDATYPARLMRALESPPPVVYAFGSLDVLDGPLFAVANSNGASDGALQASDTVAAEAVAAGWTPVTGHNRVAYQRPALVARRHGARVCYVMDRGLRQGFGGDLRRDLFAAARIWNPAYDPARDLALSPFGLDEHGTGGNNRRRDEIVFALADAVVVGFVRPGGRMEKACRAARTRGALLLEAAASPEAVREALARPGMSPARTSL